MRRFRERYRAPAMLVVVSLASACAADADTFLDVTYDPCGAEVTPHESATADEIASVDAALALWNERGGFDLVRAPHAGGAAVDGGAPRLLVRFQREFAAFRGFYDDEAGEIIINRGLAADVRAIALAHELGHAFGLWHVDRSKRRSVMNPGNTTIEPSAGDVEELRALWGRCP